MQERIEKEQGSPLVPGLCEAIKIIDEYVATTSCEYEYSADVGNWKPVKDSTNIKRLLEIGFNVRRKQNATT